MTFNFIESVEKSGGIVGPYGERFGRLVVLHFDHIEYGPGGRVYYYDLCRCDCGNEKLINRLSYTQHQENSCGCITRERMRGGKKNHLQKTNNKPPKHNHELYMTHYNMIKKCYDKKTKLYPKFGGIGISVCDRWKDSFSDFVADVESEIGPRPDNTSFFTRIDSSGNYEPGNIRWATSIQLAKEKRKPKHKLNWYANSDETGIGYIGNICFEFE